MVWIPFVAIPAAVALVQLGSMSTLVTVMTLALKLSGVVIVVLALALIYAAYTAPRRR